MCWGQGVGWEGRMSKKQNAVSFNSDFIFFSSSGIT